MEKLDAESEKESQQKQKLSPIIKQSRKSINLNNRKIIVINNPKLIRRTTFVLQNKDPVGTLPLKKDIKNSDNLKKVTTNLIKDKPNNEDDKANKSDNENSLEEIDYNGIHFLI